MKSWSLLAASMLVLLVVPLSAIQAQELSTAHAAQIESLPASVDMTQLRSVLKQSMLFSFHRKGLGRVKLRLSEQFRIQLNEGRIEGIYLQGRSKFAKDKYKKWNPASAVYSPSSKVLSLSLWRGGNERRPWLQVDLDMSSKEVLRFRRVKTKKRHCPHDEAGEDINPFEYP